jgi:hypothetical protein
VLPATTPLIGTPCGRYFIRPASSLSYRRRSDSVEAFLKATQPMPIRRNNEEATAKHADPSKSVTEKRIAHFATACSMRHPRPCHVGFCMDVPRQRKGAEYPRRSRW